MRTMPGRLRHLPEGLARACDALDELWERHSTQRRLAALLIGVFLASLAVVELGRRGALPEVVAQRVSGSHFAALEVAFTLLLIMEVVGLVFGITRSVADAVGKQFEILALILLRQSFKELAHLPEPVVWQDAGAVVPKILSDAVGALAIFVVLGFYYRLQQHRRITRDEEEQTSFLRAKKLIALLLLVSLAAIGVEDTWRVLATGGASTFFEAFYTLLIFADVLIVLISLRYSTRFPVVFRYFGFAVATVLARLALSAPRFIDAGLGLGAALFALALTLAYNVFAPVLHQEAEAADSPP